MKTIKAFTDLDQSKKLANILPLKLESADMTWRRVTNNITGEIIWKQTVGLDGAIKDNLFSFRNGYVYPCWSLAALISVLPEPSLHQDRDGKWYCDAQPNRMYFSGHYDYPVDACFELVMKFHELKIL